MLQYYGPVYHHCPSKDITLLSLYPYIRLQIGTQLTRTAYEIFS
jgi:hypothetical protein